MNGLLIVCVLVVVQSAYGVLKPGDYVPDSWSEDTRAVLGTNLYVKDPDNCRFGYVCDMNGLVKDAYDCTKFDAFFSLDFKVCATEAALRAHGKETCEYNSPSKKFTPLKDDPRCDKYPNQGNVDPDNCHRFIMCWDNTSLNMVECQKGTGFDDENQRCENLTPSTVGALCGNRNVPSDWIMAEI